MRSKIFKGLFSIVSVATITFGTYNLTLNNPRLQPTKKTAEVIEKYIAYGDNHIVFILGLDVDDKVEYVTVSKDQYTQAEVWQNGEFDVIGMEEISGRDVFFVLGNIFLIVIGLYALFMLAKSEIEDYS